MISGMTDAVRVMEERIIGVLKAHEEGAKPADLARKRGVSVATLCI